MSDQVETQLAQIRAELEAQKRARARTGLIVGWVLYTVLVAGGGAIAGYNRAALEIGRPDLALSRPVAAGAEWTQRPPAAPRVQLQPQAGDYDLSAVADRGLPDEGRQPSPPASLARPVEPSAKQSAAGQGAASPRPAPGLVSTGDPAGRVLPDRAISQKVIETLAALPAVKDGPDGERPIYVFFDPRCPYCHKAHDALDGKLPLRWIPVAALGNSGDVGAKIRAILGAANPAQALKSAFAKKDLAAPVTVVDDKALEDAENIFSVVQSFLSRAGATTLGVPTFVVPRADGSLGFYVGFDNDLLAKLSEMREG